MSKTLKPTQSRISIKGLKVAEFMSEETLAYTATVYFDGKQIASADNGGRGGATHIRAETGQQDLFKQAEAFALSLPATLTDYEDPKDPSGKLSIVSSLEWVVDGLAHEQQDRKKATAQMTRLMKKAAVMLEEGKLFTLKPKNPALLQSEAFLKSAKERYPAAQILNAMPKEQALELFIANTSN
jgi:hypothetical protein